MLRIGSVACLTIEKWTHERFSHLLVNRECEKANPKVTWLRGIRRFIRLGHTFFICWITLHQLITESKPSLREVWFFLTKFTFSIVKLAKKKGSFVPKPIPDGSTLAMSCHFLQGQSTWFCLISVRQCSWHCFIFF